MSWQTYIIHPYVTSGVLAAIVGIALVWCGRQNIGRLFTRTAFFWLVNIVFMAISAYHAAPFFGSVVSTIPGLEWAAQYIGLPVALVIDGVTIVFMQARMEASYKRDYKKQGMYTRYVFAAAGLNTIANLYTDIQHFQASSYNNIPSIMVTFAPMVLSVFPMFLVAISKAADEMVNIKPLEKLNVAEFEAQEKKRVEILEVQAFYLERETVAMQRLIAVERLQKENELLRRAIPTKSFSWPWQKAVDIDAIVAGVTAQIKAVYEPQIEALKQRLEEAQTPVISAVIPTPETRVLDMPNSGEDDGDSDAADSVETPAETVQKSPPNNAFPVRRSVTVKEASVMLNLSESYVRDLRKKGVLKRSSGNANLIVVSSILKYQETRQNAGNSGPLPTQKPELAVHDTDALSPVQPEPDQHWQSIKSELANGHSREPFPLANLIEIEV